MNQASYLYSPATTSTTLLERVHGLAKVRPFEEVQERLAVVQALDDVLLRLDDLALRNVPRDGLVELAQVMLDDDEPARVKKSVDARMEEK